MVSEVTCSDSRVILNPGSNEDAIMIYGWFSSRPELLVITSHYGCNYDGERAPHR